MTPSVDLDAINDSVVLPDDLARDAARERQQHLTKPAGALGALEELSVWLCGRAGQLPTVAPSIASASWCSPRTTASPSPA